MVEAYGGKHRYGQAYESFLTLAEEGGFDAWSAFINSQQACLATETGAIA